mgnify:FL=1
MDAEIICQAGRTLQGHTGATQCRPGAARG